MPAAPRTTDADVARAYMDAGTLMGAAKALGLATSGVRKRLVRVLGPMHQIGSEGSFATVERWLAERGHLPTDPVMPGFAIRRTTHQTGPEGELQKTWITQAKAAGSRGEIPAGHVVKGVSQLRDSEGRVTQEWVKTREGRDPVAVVEMLRGAFADYRPGAPATPMPEVLDDDTLTLLPLADAHIGMFAWHREVGENWDTDIAERVIGGGIETAIERSPRSARAVLLGGGDLLHADNQENRTAHSGNQLDVDGRYPRVLKVACRLMVRAVEAMLRRHGHVTVRILRGNHDEHASVAVAYFIMAWFRNEPRVTVDVDPGLFWWHRFGSVMLGATHGHTVKLKDMPQIMAARRAADWGATRFRYIHGFHIHHRSAVATEGGGCIAESHQAPIPQDAWHFGAGFLSGRSIQTITYHRDFGEVSRARVAILDAAREAA